MRVYIDVTDTVGSDRHTGIQRVVRCLSTRLVDAIPGSCLVALRYDGLHCVPRDLLAAHAAAPPRPVAVRPRKLLRAAVARLAAALLLNRLLPGQRLYERLHAMLWWPAAAPARARAVLSARGQAAGSLVLPAQGDLLLLLDSTWRPAMCREVAGCRARGCRVVAVVYDLIPLLHPHYHDGLLVLKYRTWFARIAELSDGFICISRSVANDLRRVLDSTQPARRTPVEFFYPGSDLPSAQTPTRVRPELAEFLARGAPVFLMVGTVEPRKNHRLVLDALCLLWRRGLAVRLLVVGRPGWKCGALVRRLRRLAQASGRLVWLEDASDSELAFCYDRAAALLFPSLAEGFGLPIVEALQRGARVLASDIPVHREVGGDSVRYFAADGEEQLADLIAEVSAQGPSRAPAPRRPWLTWDGSAAAFLAALVRLAGPAGLEPGNPQVSKVPG